MIAVLAEYVDDAVLVVLLTLCQATQHTTVNDYGTPLSLVERTEKNSAGFTEAGTVRHRQTKEASILRSHHEATRELPGERDNARNNARTTHGLDGQHQDVDRTPHERVNQNDRGQT